MSIVEVTDAIICPRTMVICNTQNVKEMMPKISYPFAAHNYCAVSIAKFYWQPYSPVALSAMMRPWRLIPFASTAVARGACQLLNLVPFA